MSNPNLLGKKRKNSSDSHSSSPKKTNLHHQNKEDEEMIKLNESFIQKARNHPLSITKSQNAEIHPNISPLKFQIIKKFNKARASIMTLPHSEVETPIYMPVGTKGTMKGLLSCDFWFCFRFIYKSNTNTVFCFWFYIKSKYTSCHIFSL